MKLFFLFLTGLLFISTSYPLSAQEKETARLLSEAGKNRYINPEKSLKLLDYLLKNTGDPKLSTAIQIRKIEANLHLGNYKKAVKNAQRAKQALQDFSDEKLQFKYRIQASALYKKLDLFRESQHAFQKARAYYKKLSNSQQKNLAPQLKLARLKQKDSSSNLNPAQGLKDLAYENRENSNLQTWIYYQIAKLYYPAKKDSARAYFQRVIANKKSSFLSKKARVFSALIEHGYLKDSLKGLRGFLLRSSPTLQSIWLKQQVDYWKRREKTDSILKYTQHLSQIRQRVHFKKRQAKVLLLEDIYFDRHSTKEKAIARQRLWYWVGIGLITLVLLFYFTYPLFKKEKRKPLQEESALPKKIVIPTKTEKEILGKLKEFENSDLFLDKKIRLASLAQHLNTNTRYLSTIINSSKNKGFNNYINSLRIHYITSKLKSDPQYANYKISYLAKESGFASQSSFTAAFKEVTGLTPSVFIKKISR